jgi:hypothetical protein
MMQEHTVLRHAERSASRVIDGTAVVVVIDTQKLHTLNELGTRVWELFDGRSIGEIADSVVEQYEVERSVALADLVRFAEEMVKLGALEVEGKG